MTDRYENIRKALAMGPTPGPRKAHDQSASGWVDITHSAYATPLCYALPHSEPLVGDSPGDALAALAQQPAGVDEARSVSSIMDGAVSFVETLAARVQGGRDHG